MTRGYDYGEGWSTDEEEEGQVCGPTRGAAQQIDSLCALCGEEVWEGGGVRTDGCNHRVCWRCLQSWASHGAPTCPACHLAKVPAVPVPGEGDRWQPESADAVARTDTWQQEGADEFVIEDTNVMCLPGASCRLRSGATWQGTGRLEGELSVACDSCDKWFHALCVHFTHSDSHATWLCPSCHLASCQPPTSSLSPPHPHLHPHPPSGEVKEDPPSSPRREALTRIAAKVAAELRRAEAKLPDEMKPMLKLNLRSRIPTAIRQTYLSQWVSLHLYLARPPLLERNEEPEAAIAAALSAESSIFGGAGGKGVYETVSKRALGQAWAAARHKRKEEEERGEEGGEVEEGEEKTEEGGQGGGEEGEAMRIEEEREEEEEKRGEIEGAQKSEVGPEQKEEVGEEEGEAGYSNATVDGDGGAHEDVPPGGVRVAEKSNLYAGGSLPSADVIVTSQAVTEALRATGLISDSPPSSPDLPGGKGGSMMADVDARIRGLRPIIMCHVRADGGMREEDWEGGQNGGGRGGQVWGEELGDERGGMRGMPGGDSGTAEEGEPLIGVGQGMEEGREEGGRMGGWEVGKEVTVGQQVELFVVEHLQPLVRSAVIDREQCHWAAKKTTAKVMQHHAGATSAQFLITEGSKVRRLAEQYVESYKKLEASG